MKPNKNLGPDNIYSRILKKIQMRKWQNLSLKFSKCHSSKDQDPKIGKRQMLLLYLKEDTESSQGIEDLIAKHRLCAQFLTQL